MFSLYRSIVIFGLVLCYFSVYAKPLPTEIQVVYFKAESEAYAGVPRYLQSPDGEGFEGALTALDDANKTGKFLGYQLVINEINKPIGEKFNDEQESLLKSATAIIIDASHADFNSIITELVKINSESLLLNVRNHDDEVRSQFCNEILLHVAPSYQMKTDAIAQWMLTKRIRDVLVISGDKPEDKQHSAAFKASAKKFKLDIIEDKEWQFSFDLRRSAFSEIPVFTRTRKKHETIFVSDHAKQYAFSLPYNTHYMVPVTGSAGLQALAWHRAHEQWGARQLQNRFSDRFKRPMTEYDYLAYTAIIAISTAVQKTKNYSGKELYRLLVEDSAPIASYKGRQLTFRQSTRQLRQPILLANEGALVTHAPLAGFLHQSNDLDTLGPDNQTCEAK